MRGAGRDRQLAREQTANPGGIVEGLRADRRNREAAGIATVAAVEALHQAARAREEAVARLHDAGLTDQQIADELGLADGSVGNIRTRIGRHIRPPARRFTPAERQALDQQVKAMVFAGDSDVTIAAALGISPNFVREARGRLDLVQDHRPAPPSCDAFDVALAAAGAWFEDEPRAAAFSARHEPLPDYMNPWFLRVVPGAQSSLG